MGLLLSKAELESALAGRFGAAIRFREKPAAQFLPSGIAEVDALAGGLPRGGITEVFGPASSGRTSLMLSTLAAATAREEICALVDTTDAFSPASGAAAGIALDRLLWVRCGGNATGTRPSAGPGPSGARNALRAGQTEGLIRALKVLDLLLQGGGFGLVVFDLGDIPPRYARRIPLASWFRFRRVIENTPTVMLAIEQEANAKSCASLVLEMERARAEWSGRLLRGARIQVARRKPAGTALHAQSTSFNPQIPQIKSNRR